MRTRHLKNIFTNTPETLSKESFETILEGRGSFSIERIVSQGHVTPPEQWYDQDWDEWVLVVAGRAKLLFEDNDEVITMSKGDYMNIRAHRRHRVIWTDPSEKTTWLAVHHRIGR